MAVTTMMLKIQLHFINIESFQMKYVYRLLQYHELVSNQKRLHQQYHKPTLINSGVYKTSTTYSKNARLIFLQNNHPWKRCYLSSIIVNMNTTTILTLKCKFQCSFLLIQS